MKLNKFIFSKEEDIKKSMFDFYDFEIIKKTDKFKLYKIQAKYKEEQESEDELFFIIYIDFDNSFKYINENHVLDKIIVLGFANISEGFDIKQGDVIIPNTFVNSKDDETIFLEYSIGQNYDFNKFGLILNGICTSGESSCERGICADIVDEDSFFVLKEISTFGLLDKTVVVKGIVGDDKNGEVGENIINIINIFGIIV